MTKRTAWRGIGLGLALMAAAASASASASAAAEEGVVEPASGPVVAYTVVDGRAIPESLTGAPGDAERGRTLYAEPRAGCAGCHETPERAGGAAPGLSDVGARLAPGEIRLWLVAPEVLAPETAMPAYYAAGQRTDPGDPLYGGPALTASEIEDLVAYLSAIGAD